MTPSRRGQSTRRGPSTRRGRSTSHGRSTPRCAVALVRHGHFDRPEGVASAHLLHPLSARGREQAEQAVEVLRAQAEELGLEIDPQIESSQLLRANETARIIAQGLSDRLGRTFHVRDWPDLVERSLGSCANLRFSEIERLLGLDPRLGSLPDDWRRAPHFRLPVPGAESQMQSGERTARRLRERVEHMHRAAAGDSMKIVVAHGGCLRHACVHLGILEIGAVSKLTMGHAESIVIEKRDDDTWVRTAGEWRERIPSMAAGPTPTDAGSIR